MMRYRLVVVAGPKHPLANRATVSARQAASHEWLVGASGADPSSAPGQLLMRLGVPESRLRVFPSEAAAWAAASDGHGLATAVAHIVQRDVDRGALVVVPLEGTPVDLLWYVSMLAAERCSPAATKLRRFLGTPDAMQVMHRSDGSVPASRFRPPVYVTLWS
jgi:DNA-binding transcriptional LysR family regulator